MRAEPSVNVLDHHSEGDAVIEMCLMSVRQVEHPHTVGLIRRRLHQDGPNGVDETLAFSCEILLITGW